MVAGFGRFDKCGVVLLLEFGAVVAFDIGAVLDHGFVELCAQRVPPRLDILVAPSGPPEQAVQGLQAALALLVCHGADDVVDVPANLNFELVKALLSALVQLARFGSCFGTQIAGKTLLEYELDTTGGILEQVKNGIVREAELAVKLLDGPVAVVLDGIVLSVEEGEDISGLVHAAAAGASAHLKVFLGLERAHAAPVVFALTVKAHGAHGVVDAHGERLGAIEQFYEPGGKQVFYHVLKHGQEASMMIRDSPAQDAVQ